MSYKATLKQQLIDLQYIRFCMGGVTGFLFYLGNFELENAYDYTITLSLTAGYLLARNLTRLTNSQASTPRHQLASISHYFFLRLLDFSGVFIHLLLYCALADTNFKKSETAKVLYANLTFLGAIQFVLTCILDFTNLHIESNWRNTDKSDTQLILQKSRPPVVQTWLTFVMRGGQTGGFMFTLLYVFANGFSPGFTTDNASTLKHLIPALTLLLTVGTCLATREPSPSSLDSDGVSVPPLPSTDATVTTSLLSRSADSTSPRRLKLAILIALQIATNYVECLLSGAFEKSDDFQGVRASPSPLFFLDSLLALMGAAGVLFEDEAKPASQEAGISGSAPRAPSMGVSASSQESV